jgi:hypothetical protein
MLFGVDWVLGTVLPSVALFLSLAAPTDEASRMLLSSIASYHQFVPFVRRSMIDCRCW